LNKGLDKQKTQQLLKEELGWDSPDKCQDGFWLDKHTFIKADSLQVVKLDRQMLDGEKKSGPIPMVILNGVVEMLVDKNNKILSVEVKDRFGLWLDALSKILKKKY
jgi:hypothetical protein